LLLATAIPTFLLTTDRASAQYLRALARLQKQGLKPYTLETPRQADGKLGCGLAHKLATDFAYEAGLSEVLIFEDDVVLRNDAMALFTKARAEVPGSCKRLFLGSLFYGHLARGEVVGPTTLKTVMNLHCHAYWLSLCGIAWQHKALKEWLSATRAGSKLVQDAYLVWHTSCADYNVNPIVAIQESGYSDIDKRVVIRGPTYFGGYGPWKLDDFWQNCPAEDRQFVTA
jgi:hypothetical protein